VPIALAAQGGGAEPALVEIVETMVLSDPDPIARGLARRALAVTVRDEPLKILSSPEVAVPWEAMLVPYLEPQDTTGDLLSLLLLVDDGDESQAAAAEIARRIIEVGTFVYYDLGAGDLYANSAFDRLGRESAYSDRPEVRAWATRILRSVERGPAPLELGRLLTDPDPRVRALAIDAIQEVDLRQARWIEDALLGYYALETGKAAAGLPAFLIANLPSEVLEDLIQLTEAYLDDHPGNPGALYLLESGRAIAHA